MNIEIIAGSPREGSLSRRVALHLHARLHRDTAHHIGVLDMRHHGLPPIQAVWSNPEQAPEEFREIAARMFAAQALILVTPEYNGGYAPAMKNFLDHFPKQARKPFGLCTASPGGMGGMRAAQQMLQLVPALFGIASPGLLIVPGVDKKFDESGALTDTLFENSVHNFLTEFLWLAERLAPARALMEA